MGSTLLLLFLLSLSIYVCNGRHHGVVNQGSHQYMKKAEFDLIKTPLKREKVWPDGIQGRRRLSINEEGDVEQRSGNDSMEKKFESEDFESIVDGRGEIVSGVRIESLLRVSWKIPHKNNGDHNLGFHLDYSGPRTHPPSHN